MKTQDKLSDEKALEKEIRMKLGCRIKMERERKGYTQEYMASHLNTSESHYSNIETGKRNCSMSKLVKICKTLEISADDLLKDYFPTDFLAKEKKVNHYYEKMNSEQRKCLVAIACAYCENTRVIGEG